MAIGFNLPNAYAAPNAEGFGGVDLLSAISKGFALGNQPRKQSEDLLATMLQNKIQGAKAKLAPQTELANLYSTQSGTGLNNLKIQGLQNKLNQDRALQDLLSGGSPSPQYKPNIQIDSLNTGGNQNQPGNITNRTGIQGINDYSDNGMPAESPGIAKSASAYDTFPGRRSNQPIAQTNNAPVSLKENISNGMDYGLIVPGNIDLNNRPMVKNTNGDTSTVFTMTAGIDNGKVALLPRVINGKIVSEQEAFNHFKKTGQHMGIFDSEQSADKFDEQLHNNKGWMGPNNKWPNNTYNNLNDDNKNIIEKGNPNLYKIDELYDANPQFRKQIEARGFKKTQTVKYDPKTGNTTTITTYPSGKTEISNTGVNDEYSQATTAIKTKNQNTINAIKNARPIIEDIIKQTDAGNIPGQWIGHYFHPDKNASYISDVIQSSDTLAGALGFPGTNEGIHQAQQTVLRKPRESDAGYSARLKKLLVDMDKREQTAIDTLNPKKGISLNESNSNKPLVIDYVRNANGRLVPRK